MLTSSSLPADRIFRASHMQRDYRLILDTAKRDDLVQVLDKDDTALAVEPWETAAFLREMLRALDNIRQFKAVYARHKAEPVKDWAAMTPFPWLAAIEDEHVADFDEELLVYLFLAVQQRDMTAYDGNLRAWESTAETADLPEMLDAMRAAVTGSPIEVHPPSAEQIAAAELA